jgi:glutamate synthase (NADPH/NADH) small chain
MGKKDGFLKYDRKEPGYRPKEERIKDYRAVELQAEEEEIYRQAARCMDCGVPFCHGYGCPVANVIPEFNDMVYRGHWKEALDILLSTNNFPEFTGRLCPALCEAACVSGINTDPVTIRQIELSVIEKGFQTGQIGPNPPSTYHREQVAVIGSGPAGLAAADTLNKSGYKVTVYDEAEQPGGLLRYGIPDFKLDKAIVARRIALMKAEGVLFETGIRIGTDVSFRYLNRHFDAICLACGSRQPKDLDVPGRDLAGIHFAMDFLVQQNQRLCGEFVESAEAISAANKSVVIIGGGDTGSDCLGTALRQGAHSVLQLEILPKPPLERPAHTPWPTWPQILRKSHAHKEGGDIRWSVTTKAFTGIKGTLEKLICVEVEWTADKPGGPLSPKEKPETEFEVNADLAILAMGFTGPGNRRLLDNFNLDLDDRGNIKADNNWMTSVDGVFVAGDMTSGQSLIVRAIYSGRKAAENIVSYLSGNMN